MQECSFEGTKPVPGRARGGWLLTALLGVLLSGCDDERPRPPPEPQPWSIVAQDRSEALLSITGRSRSDVWADAGERGAALSGAIFVYGR
jgi:hypothetical protein